MFQTKFVDKIKAHVLCLITFFQKLWFSEMMWKIFVEPDKPQMTV